MRLLITGVCGFVGSTLARSFAGDGAHHTVLGLDNFVRPGSSGNRIDLARRGIKLFHADLRSASDLEVIPSVDWVVDAAANPSVLAGVDGLTSSRQLVEHNLNGTINLLEFCKARKAGLVLLSTSRVYSIRALATLPMVTEAGAFALASDGRVLPAGVSARGVTEDFATSAPLSLYGSTKLASEALALEYGEAFGFPVFVARCGVLAGAGQFGRTDQGIFSYWIHSWRRQRPLAYLGFGGTGHQVRDCLHPRDLVPLLEAFFASRNVSAEARCVNASGGVDSAMSLLQLSEWCTRRFGPHAVRNDGGERPFDLPWVVLDHAKATRMWSWRPSTPREAILEGIAQHAEQNPDWLELSAPY